MSGRSLPVSPAAVGVREGKAGVWPRRLLNAGGYLALALALTLLAIQAQKAWRARASRGVQ